MASGDDPIEAELKKLDAEDEGGTPGNLRRYLPATLAVIAVVGFAGVVWYAYSTGIREGSEFAAPLLEPSGPSKVAPQDPGGREILDQDKLVYGTIDRTQDETRVERLLPPPENPLPVPVTPKPVEPPPVATPQLGVPKIPPPPSITGPLESPGSTEAAKTAAADISNKAAGAADKAVAIPPLPKPVATPKKVEPPAVPVAAAAPKPVPVAKPAATSKPAAKPAAKPAKSGADNFRVQIGSLRSEDAARTALTRRVKEAGPVLANLKFFVSKADIPGKGTYYQAQGGPFADKASAQKVCEALKKKKIGCFVVKR